MKVLWLSNGPANGSEILSGFGFSGGWLSSLDRALNGKVELFVAFYFARFAEPFRHKGVMYLPICKKKWKLNIVKKNFFGDFIDRQDLDIYLDIIGKVQPDVIHIHGTENPFGCIMSATNIPVVLSYQGSCIVYNHKYYSGIEESYASLRGIKICSPYTWIFNKSFIRGFRNSSRNRKREIEIIKSCKNIIGRTDWDRRITRILSPESQYFHNDEVLRDAFYQNKWERHKNEIIVVHSTTGGALYKGFETICQSLNELNKIGIKIEWRIAGISENSLLTLVTKRKLKKDYPGKGLILLGNLNEHELINKMLEADIYVMPSHIENSPNSLCEAMILGMPCITTLAGGSSSLLKDKEDGLVIQDGDPWSMAGAILELSQNPDLAATYGQNSRDRALNRHDPGKIVNDLLNIYQVVIENNKE